MNSTELPSVEEYAALTEDEQRLVMAQATAALAASQAAMMNVGHDEILAAVKKLNIDEDADDYEEQVIKKVSQSNYDEMNKAAKKSMKVWKKHNKPAIRKYISKLNEQIADEKRSQEDMYKLAGLAIGGRVGMSDAESKAALKTASHIKRHSQMREGLFKKAIVVLSHAHNENTLKAWKHYNQLATMAVEFEDKLVEAMDLMPYALTEEAVISEGDRVEEMLEVVRKATSTGKLIAELARPVRDVLKAYNDQKNKDDE